jgi:hypothetical protein
MGPSESSKSQVCISSALNILLFQGYKVLRWVLCPSIGGRKEGETRQFGKGRCRSKFGSWDDTGFLTNFYII